MSPMNPLDPEEERLAQALATGAAMWMFTLDPRARHVFLPLALCSREDFLSSVLQPRNVIVWQWLSEAGPMSVNGLPSFFSGNFAGPEEAKRLLLRSAWLAQAAGEQGMPSPEAITAKVDGMRDAMTKWLGEQEERRQDCSMCGAAPRTMAEPLFFDRKPFCHACFGKAKDENLRKN